MTAVSFAAAKLAIRDAVTARIQAEPSRAALCVLLGHSVTEQGIAKPERSDWVDLPCYNWAGIKWVKGCGADFTEWPTFEGHGEAVTHIRAKFRAFESIDAAAVHYVDFLSGRGSAGTRYFSAWGRALAGDPSAFGRELGAAGYFTADPEVYAARCVTGWGFAAIKMLGYGLGRGEARRFQTAAGLVADGLVGPKTRAALRLELERLDASQQSNGGVS
jgi:hypothetical protein